MGLAGWSDSVDGKTKGEMFADGGSSSGGNGGGNNNGGDVLRGATASTGVDSTATGKAGEVMAWWQSTPVGWFIVGLFGWMLVSGISQLDTGPEDAQLVAGLAIIYLVLQCGYALWLYPALFKDNPPTTSRSLVGFLNGLFGGIIFGILWNCCLSREKVGISQYVLLALVACEFVLSFAAVG